MIRILAFLSVVGVVTGGTGSNPLVVLLAALLGGSITTAITQIMISRRAERRADNKERKEDHQQLFIAAETRDNLIGEAAERAVTFMRSSLEEAQRQLEAAQRSIALLNQKIAKLQKEVDAGTAERAALRQSLVTAVEERGSYQAKAASLEERVHELEVRIGSRRKGDPPITPTGGSQGAE